MHTHAIKSYVQPLEHGPCMAEPEAGRDARLTPHMHRQVEAV